MNRIEIGYILDRVALGNIGNFPLGNLYDYKTLIPCNNLIGFGQPVLLGSRAEYF